MRKTLIALALMFQTLAAAAAGIDYTSLKQTIDSDPEAYSTLLKRFNSGDESLTPEEVATVYYGSATLAPQPSRDYTAINSLRASRRFGEMKPLCIKALDSDPVSLTLLFRLFAAAYNAPEGRDEATVASAGTRINQLCDAIFASGTGVTETEPFHVVSEGDIEQFLLNYVRVDSILGMARQGQLSVAHVKLPGRDEPAYLYFLPCHTTD